MKAVGSAAIIIAMLAVACASVGYLIKSIRVGRIRGRFLTYDRATHPFNFWLSAAMYVMLAWMACFTGLSIYLSM